MTIYGGEEIVWGTRNNGFFVSCTQCGWHSKVEVSPSINKDTPIVVFECHRCGNMVEVE